MKLGIYGGTFSPPHNGHIRAAHAFFDSVGLDRLLIMPTNIPPHKANATVSARERYKMTELAFSGDTSYGGRIVVDDYEINKAGKSYTAETLEHFSLAGDDLFFLCGTDMFLTLKNWYRPDLICKYATIVLMRRESDSTLDDKIAMADSELRCMFSAKTIEIHVPPIEISSSRIRELLVAGEDVSEYLPPYVIEYIKSRQLYNA